MVLGKEGGAVGVVVGPPALCFLKQELVTNVKVNENCSSNDFPPKKLLWKKTLESIMGKGQSPVPGHAIISQAMDGGGLVTKSCLTLQPHGL